MGLHPGQANEYYKQGGLEKYSFKNNPELHKKAIQRSAEVRRRKKEKIDSIKDNLEILLSLDVKSEKHKKILSALGIKDDEQNNKMLLTVSLFRRAISGDVNAIRHITDLMAECGIDESMSEHSQGISINIVPYKPQEPVLKSEVKEDAWEDIEGPSGDSGDSQRYSDEWDEV